MRLIPAMKRACASGTGLDPWRVNARHCRTVATFACPTHVSLPWTAVKGWFHRESHTVKTARFKSSHGQLRKDCGKNESRVPILFSFAPFWRSIFIIVVVANLTGRNVAFRLLFCLCWSTELKTFFFCTFRAFLGGSPFFVVCPPS